MVTKRRCTNFINQDLTHKYPFHIRQLSVIYHMFVIVGLECSRFYALHGAHLQASTISLNKKYSGYDGTEIIYTLLVTGELSI